MTWALSQKTAWFMLHRIREAWMHDAYRSEFPFAGPVEADETYIGGKESNKHRADKLNAGRGMVGKTPVLGVKDRATKNVRVVVPPNTAGPTLRGFVTSNAQPEATVYTDGEAAYKGLPRKHEAVKHSVGEYVRGMAHTNGMESFWSMLKRAHMGTFHKLSPKHLERYVQEFAGEAQHPRSRHDRSDARHRRQAHRSPVALRRAHRGQRARLRRAARAWVGSARAAVGHGPAFRAWHRPSRA